MTEGLIYCQKQIPKKKWRYGFRSSAATGCGWIATYNAMVLLGRPVEPEKIIRFYERQIPLLNGNAGTFVLAPLQFFGKQGFQTACTANRKRFDRLVQQSQVCLLFYFWRRGWKLGAHFVALHSTPEGIIGYNTYRNSTGPDRYGTSLEQFLKRKKYFGAVLIGVKGRKDKTV